MCIDNHYQDLKECLPKIQEGRACNHSLQCVDNALCPQGPGFQSLLSGKSSVGYSDTGGMPWRSSSFSSVMLSTGDAELASLTSVCSCVVGFYPWRGRCEPEIDSEVACNSTLQCTAGALCEMGGEFVIEKNHCL